jgi:serine/threonine protein kinase
MAQVFKAWDPNTGRYVAIKVLHQHLIDESVFKERFAREGQLIASLSHPNIVTLYDFDTIETDNGISPYMVMPFIDGPSLKDRLERLNTQGQRMPLDEVVRIVEGIAAALDYAHDKDMVHRDIKPGNILFNDQGAPLLTDFGLARLTFGARLTDSGTASGTPAYMAPEQGLGEPGDRRSDIYSLGIILHELLTGQLPFVADTGLGLLMKHIHEPLPSPRLAVPDLPPEVEAVASAPRPMTRPAATTAAGAAAEQAPRFRTGNVSPQDPARLPATRSRGAAQHSLAGRGRRGTGCWPSWRLPERPADSRATTTPTVTL